jgi:hypothetical protein
LELTNLFLRDPLAANKRSRSSPASTASTPAATGLSDAFAAETCGTDRSATTVAE